MFDQTKKPLESLAKAGTKEALKGLGKSVKEGLGGLLETVINQSKDIFKWFGNLFENIKEKGLKESLMGPFIGFLSFAENLGKNEKEASEKTKPTPSSQVARAELKKDVEKTTPK
ncbi:hypothetical protein KAR91_55000, partial [Candidatus Pacearchaeota archaeon]|nr:hypothetical protein [Candidatus Pacearchaeota archaeon]